MLYIAVGALFISFFVFFYGLLSRIKRREKSSRRMRRMRVAGKLRETGIMTRPDKQSTPRPPQGQTHENTVTQAA